MGSDFWAGDLYVAVSNGTAEALLDDWHRLLLTSEFASTPSGADVAEFLRRRLAHGGSGLYGFRVDEGIFESVEARRLFAIIVERHAFESFEALEGREGPPSLDFLRKGRDDPSFKAWWLSIHERIHDLVRRSLNGAIQPLKLPCDEQTRIAVDALWAYHQISWARRCNPDAELSLRRTFCRLAACVPEYFSSPANWISGAHYDLADLEESLGLLSDAAATTRAGAAMERDTDTRAVALQLAELRDSAARQRNG